MNSEEFARIRHHLGKSQSQLARLLCASFKAIQSYEQGWRNIPPAAERQLLLLLSLKTPQDMERKPCWETRSCPQEWKANCTAWEFKAGHLCWLMNGTFCNGEYQGEWKRKIEVCRKCEVLQSMIPSLPDR